ncbi:patatin-like phospholipase family protein [Bradyrhizobium sp. STM 3566]|uniref:patatin-like phospholipase family protein n=1 Tax=Bradyrhizobium sp. STM 3566 TaxID=578928 RepID=UPI00389045AE
MTETDAAPGSTAEIVQKATEFQWDGHGPEPGIAIAASGGGFRAMLFHAGAFQRLNELGLLSQAKRISSVSGGSIAAGYLAAIWQALGHPDRDGVFANFREQYVDPIVAFSREKVDVVDALTGFLPWTSAAEQVAATYDQHLFQGKTLQQIPDLPRFVFCSTNLQSGVLWRFSKQYAGDYLVGRLDAPAIALSRAVAASSAFPPVLSPMLLEVPPAAFADWPSGPGPLAPDVLRSCRERVVLTDGGVYDNHGLEPIVKRYYTIFASDGGAPFGRLAGVQTDWIGQLRRVLDVTDNQVRALRRRDLLARLTAGNKVGSEAALQAAKSEGRLGAYWGIDTDPGKLTPLGALPCNQAVTHRLAQIATRLSDLGEQTSKQLVNWGYAVCDRSIRANYKGMLVNTEPVWPFKDAPLS